MSGLPDKDTVSGLGGIFVDASPVQNPQTDVDAGSYNILLQDVAGMTRTACRAWVRFTTATSGSLTVNAFDTVWNEIVTNAAPSAAYSATGTSVVTFPTTIIDANNNTHTVNFQRAGVFVEGSTLLFAQVAITAANVLTVYLFNTSFALANEAGTVIHVWAQ